MRLYVLCLLFAAAAAQYCQNGGGKILLLGITNQGIHDVVNAHNKYRLDIANGRTRQPRGTNLKRMYWDSLLGQKGRVVSNTCKMDHIIAKDNRWWWVGQSLYMSWSSRNDCTQDWWGVVKAWFDEEKDFSYPNQSRGTTGHYTQVVWADTNRIGCDFVCFYNKGWYTKLYTCNYGPGLMYSYAVEDSYEQAVREARFDSTERSSATVCEWYNYCREAIVEDFVFRQKERGPIGGPGIIVQLDESKFGRRKYYRGRRIEGHWILGMIAEGSEDLRLLPCPNKMRTKEALWPIIVEHVAPGSILTAGGHTMVLRVKATPTPQLTTAIATIVLSLLTEHTLSASRQWRPAKVWHRTMHVPRELFADRLVEYQWRRKLRKAGKDPFPAL